MSEPTEEAVNEAPQPEAPAEDPMAALLAEKEALEAQAKDWQEKAEHYLRTAAELQTVLRRKQNEWERQSQYASQGMVEDLLPALDDFARGLQASADGQDLAKIVEGFHGVQRELLRALEKNGVRRIVSLGAPLDPELHEAVGIEMNADLDEDTVVEELRAGWQLHDRLVRAAQVKVSKKPDA